MSSMKNLVRLIGAFVLTTGPVISVVACGGGSSESVPVNLSTLTDSNIVINNVTINSLNSFTRKLVLTLREQQPEFKTITANDFDVFRGFFDTSRLSDNDIITKSNLDITVRAKGSKFTGSKNITVNLTTVATIDLEMLNETMTITNAVQYQKLNFISDLLVQFQQKIEFQKITSHDFDVFIGFDSTTPSLSDDDIVTNDSLKVTVTAKGTRFTGSKNITVNLTTEISLFHLNGFETINNVVTNDLNSFIEQLVLKFREDKMFKTITTDDFNVFRGFNSYTPLDSGDLDKSKRLDITVRAKGSKFIGGRNITIAFTVI